MGCSSKFQSGKLSKKLCSTEEEYVQWSRLVANATKLSESKIFEHFGCLASCTKFNFEGTRLSEMGRRPANYTSRVFVLEFYFGSGRHEVKEEYFVYDENSLIADIGGYLGLLLGQSMFGMFDSVKNVFLRLKRETI